MADDDFGEVIGIILVIAAVAVVVAVFITIASFIAGAGAIFGLGTAIKNYFLSFKNNVKFEVV